MNLITILVLLVGTVGMMIPMFFQARKYAVKLWKIIPIAFVLTITGTLGTYLWFLLENFEFGGRSFYGAIFFVPIVFILFAYIIRVPYGKLMDLCAPAECIMLSIMKIKCMIDGCCEGRLLFYTEAGEMVRFPSQAAELAVAYILAWALLMMSFREGFRGKVFAWYMIIYGSTRFALNFFREEWALYDGGMIPLGTVWSVVAVIIGIVWIIVYNNRQKALKSKAE